MSASKYGISRAITATRAAVIAAYVALWMPLARADERAVPIASGVARDQPVDVVQVDGSRVYHLQEGAGLVVYDLSDFDHPSLVGHHPIVGWPLGLVVRDKVAILVMRSSDVSSRGASWQMGGSVRALDVHDPMRPRVIGEAPIEGVIKDARTTGSKLYILSESRTPAATQTIVTAVRLDGSDVLAPRALRRDGSDGALRVIGGRVVLAHNNKPRQGTRVDVIDDDAATGLTVRGSVDLTATMDREDRDVSERLDAADPAHVRVLGCRTIVCAAGDTLEITNIDTTDATRPRVVSVFAVRSPGAWLATRFDGSRLYLSRRGWLGLGAASTSLSVVNLDAGELREAQIPAAVVWNLIPFGSRLFAVATRGDEDVRREQVLIDAIAVRDGEAPSLDVETVIGDGWASSPAQESSGALSVCGTHLAVAFRTLEFASANPRSAVALFGRSAHGFEWAGEVAVSGVVERLVCVRARLFAVSDRGIWSINATDKGTPDIGSAVLSQRRNVASQ